MSGFAFGVRAKSASFCSHKSARLWILRNLSDYAGCNIPIVTQNYEASRTHSQLREVLVFEVLCVRPYTSFC